MIQINSGIQAKKNLIDSFPKHAKKPGYLNTYCLISIFTSSDEPELVESQSKKPSFTPSSPLSLLSLLLLIINCSKSSSLSPSVSQ